MSLYVPVTFDAIPDLLEQGVPESDILTVLKKVASKFTREIQRSTPVDTGRLRRSIRVELLLDGLGVAVTSEVFYAGFVEFGTRKMRPRSFVESNISDMLNYGNQLLSELAGRSIRTQLRTRSNEDALYTGATIKSVTLRDLDRVRSLVVRDATLQISTVQSTNLVQQYILEGVG